MDCDVVIVGAGPAGLAAAIRLRQLARETGRETSVTVLEKGAEVGAHILSGAVFDPRALNELIPDWREKGAPLATPARSDEFRFLTARGGVALPGFLLPPPMRNHGNYVISLGALCRWLGRQAEALGADIYPGFAAADVLHESDGRSPESPPATWASPATGRASRATRRAWTCGRNTPCSPKARAAR